MPAPSLDEAYAWYEREVDLLTSAARTGSPTQDPQSSFFGTPHDEFLEILRDLRGEIEQRAFLAIVSATEATVHLDFMSRAKARRRVPLAKSARKLTKGATRVTLDEVLDAWTSIDDVRSGLIGEFRQLLLHRHWLAHGRHFVNRAGVPLDPAFAFNRSRAMLDELARLDSEFPRISRQA